MDYLKSIFAKFLNWLFRPVNLIMKAGFFLVLAGVGVGGWNSIEAEHRSADGSVTLLSVSAEGGAEVVEILLIALGILFLLGEVVYIWRKRTSLVNIVVEHVALRSKLSGPLANAVDRLPGKESSHPIDLSPYYRDYRITHPQRALDITVVSLQEALPSKVKECGNKEITVHYGGTPPVSHGFLAGHLMGSTYNISVWDYNRTKQVWYVLDGYSDSNKPVTDLSNYQPAEEVALVMEISHPIRLEDVFAAVPGIPFVHVTMPKITYDNMSSIEKVTEFQREFSELLKRLNHDGIKTVHIFCAAQASFNFSMGRQITRNHPQCIVYEYDRQGDKKYPWGICVNSNEPKVVIPTAPPEA